MLRLTIENSLYQVKFFYKSEVFGVITKGKFADLSTEGIECTILKDELIVSKGSAYCNPVDKFDKKVGRKIALIRALVLLPREIRTIIWHEYFRLSPKSKR